MPRTPRSPQDKKRLSFERDGRNVYAENDKTARKAIPKFKALSNRRLRHKARSLLQPGEIDDGNLIDVSDARLATATFHGLNPKVRKIADSRLGLVIGTKTAARSSSVTKPQVSRRRTAISKQISKLNTLRYRPAVHDQGGRRGME